MPNFTCVLNLGNLPAEARRGQTVRTTVTVMGCSAPVGGVTIEAVDYGIRKKFRQIDETTFELELPVPFLVPPGSYRYAVWAVSKTGEAAARQQGTIVIR